MTLLYHADPERGAEWAQLFAERAPEIPFEYRPDAIAPDAVRFLAVWHPPAGMLQRYSNLEVLFRWAPASISSISATFRKTYRWCA